MAVPRVAHARVLSHDAHLLHSFPRLSEDLARKRHATVFPSSLDLTAAFRQVGLGVFDPDPDADTDDISTWEFKAPAQPFIHRQLKRDNNKSSVTPAQEIARRYRAGLTLDLDGKEERKKEEERNSGSSTKSSPSLSPTPSTLANSGSDEAETRSCWAGSGSNEWSVPTSPVVEPMLKHRPSRTDALARNREEAEEEMRRFGMGEDWPLVCPRPGCRDTLANVNALTYHLHLHDINLDSMHGECTKCKATFSSRCARHFHICSGLSRVSRRCRIRERIRSTPSSPILATFQHVLAKITSLN